MKYKSFGNNERVSALGLGCMTMSNMYGQADDAESVATLHYALELGINFWDTADVYGNGANEELLAKVLVPNRDKVFLATKFGFVGNLGGGDLRVDASPAYLKGAVERSLRRLRIETIDLYYAHRLDPNVPVEETVGAMAELVQEGKVRHLGLSEVSASTLRRAHATHPIGALQSEYSVLSREVEAAVLPACQELGILFVPFSPLARGLMTNTVQLNDLQDNDFRKNMPRYQPEHQANNQQLAAGFAALAQRNGCSAAQLALAWVLAQGDNILPIPGTKKREKLADNVGSVDVVLTPQTLTELDELLQQYPNVGERGPAANLKLMDPGKS